MIVGQSAAIERVKRMAEISAKTDANVLLCGETGVGKDLLATTFIATPTAAGSRTSKWAARSFPRN